MSDTGGKELTPQERDGFEFRGRVEGALDTIAGQLSEIFNQLRRLPCERHLALLEQLDKRGTTALGAAVDRVVALEAQMALVSSGGGRVKPPSSETRPKSGTGYAVITQRDFENSQRLVLAEAEAAAERTVEERLALVEERQAKRREETRQSVKWWLEIAKTVIALLVGSGIVFAARCELPARSAASEHQRLQQVLAAPAPRPDANITGR